MAWEADKNASAIAVATLENHALTLEALVPAVTGVAALAGAVESFDRVCGVAIDASLIINNQSGARACERALSRDYITRKASCHPTNRQLYPDAASVRLSEYLQQQGFQHVKGDRWQLECYPHPALIECFGLPERLLYKKGCVADKKQGQIMLARLLKSLAGSPVLSLYMPGSLSECLDERFILSLKGAQIKQNEDQLDAIVCVYIAGLYQQQVTGQLYGDISDGYIWVPKVKCI